MSSSPSWRLHEGDCLELLHGLEPESVHAVVTDPPYCSGGHQEASKRSAGSYIAGLPGARLDWFSSDDMGTPGATWLLREVARGAHRALVPGGSVLMFTDWRMVPVLVPVLESAGLRYQNLVVWDKPGTGPGRGFRSSHELVLHLCKGVGDFYTVDARNVLTVSRVHGSKKVHPTEKPVELLEQLVRVVTPPGGTVVDPFAGSGSSGVAALRLGRSWIGAEVSPTFCDAIRRRLGTVGELAQGQAELFGGEPEAVAS